MERRKVEKSLKDWANSLGFRSPSGTTLPSDYFAAFGATPHRRKLWETIVDLVQPRKKIERMRKEILAARLKGFLGKTAGKEDRLDLWEKRKKLEEEVREKRNEVSKLENNILTKSSDLVLEICKLAELEKQCEEYKEKQLVLLLYAQRQKKLIKEFESILKSSDSGLKCYEVLKEFNNMEKELAMSEVSDVQTEKLWQESVECKKTTLDKFKHLVEEIQSKNIFSEKITSIDESLNSSLGELKQRMTEEALEVMVNTKEGKTLNTKIEELISKLEETCGKDESFNDSFYAEGPGREKCVEVFVNHAKTLALKSYQDFLQNELTKLEEKRKQKGSQEVVEKFEFVLKSMETVSREIQTLKLQKQQLSNDVVSQRDELLISLENIKREHQEETYRKTVEDGLFSIKAALEKQIGIFIQTPLDAFRKVETPEGILFESESLPHCLNNYGGEWKEFFTAALIPPKRNVAEIIAELKNRKKLIEELKEFISKSEKLVQCEKTILDSVSPGNIDSRICEKNFKDADGILWKISFRSQQLYPEIEFLKKILKNWVEQPYRLMIKETQAFNGLTLKQYEEIYRKENR